MNGLILHCGGQRAALDQVAAVDTPEPTKSWHPIPHIRLLEQVRGTLEGSGLIVSEEAHALARDGLRYFGLLAVVPAVGEVRSERGADYGLMVGVRNSHDQSFPAALAVGSRVFVCDNLAFSSEVVLARKHTTYIERDLPSLVSRAVGRLSDLRVDQDRRIEAYKHAELGRKDADHLIMECFRRRIINLQRIDDVWQEYETPRHPEFAQDGYTAWRFFNAVTEALKGQVFALPRATQALHGLLDTVAGIEVAQAERVS